MGRTIEYPPSEAFEELRMRTLAFESETAQRYREFSAWFAERGMQESCVLCEALAMIHRDCHTKLAAAGKDPASAMAVEQPCGVDWEELIESGGGPGLALGVERRLRRGPPGP